MLYISTALYIEAQEFIKKLNLKRDNSITKFEVFKNEDVLLIITGVGKVKSAVAVSYLLSKYDIKENDLFINIGVCGCRDRNVQFGEIFICNKILDNDTKYTYYPDMLLAHPFKEASIETFSRKVAEEEVEAELVDMESSALYQAASLFFQPHQIIFLKIVSDYLNPDIIDNKHIINIIERNADSIISWLNTLGRGLTTNKEILTKYEEDLINMVAENLKMSTTMKFELKQLLIYYKLVNNDIMEVLKKYLELECKSKNEGKMHFADLKNRLVK
ncbi:Spore photoproduct(EC:) [Thermobrachium celere]|uniref:Spore photoproduct( EC: ) n=1 Tax=Thermobrachium celere DSM 8682 TaxID=941824 RepID=R7RSQ6_9CLOT|nr:Spore photoproduct(EC:) [Thermobrachium celere]CDF58416.1 Spore photoproduct(EC:) [Thermobrachium celere DSM 8682]